MKIFSLIFLLTLSGCATKQPPKVQPAAPAPSVKQVDTNVQNVVARLQAQGATLNTVEERIKHAQAIADEISKLAQNEKPSTTPDPTSSSH